MHATYLGANGWLLEIGPLRVLGDPWLTGTLEFPPGPWFFQGELSQPQPVPQQLDLLLLSQGLLVGLLTGVAGVGGGFAIVPALVLLAGLPLPLASGTSLLLIALNALVALAAQGHWPAAGLPLLVPLLLGGAVGATIGQRLEPHLSERRLRQGFSLLLISGALFTGAQVWKHRNAETQSLASPVQAGPTR